MYTVSLQPGRELFGDKFRSVIAPGIAGAASLSYEFGYGLQHLLTVHLLLHSDFQALPSVFIEHRQEFELRALFRTGMHNVETPDVIGLLCGKTLNVCRPWCVLPRALPRQGHSLQFTETLQSLMVHPIALTSHQGRSSSACHNADGGQRVGGVPVGSPCSRAALVSVDTAASSGRSQGTNTPVLARAPVRGEAQPGHSAWHS